jgi:LacI family transcriptional regulator
MRDIAKDLGFSVITVSKVLRNHPEVGPDTRERVLSRFKELDYRPNRAARSLVTGRTYLVGLVVPDLLHPFFAELAKSLSDVLRKSGYYLIIASSEEDPDLEQHEVDQLLARQLGGLIDRHLASDPRSDNREKANEARTNGTTSSWRSDESSRWAARMGRRG